MLETWREVQDIAKAREAPGGVMPIQMCAVRGKGGKKGNGVKGQKQLTQAEKEKEDATEWAEKNKDKT